MTCTYLLLALTVQPAHFQVFDRRISDPDDQLILDDEAKFHEAECEVSFGTEDMTFVLRGDLNEDLMHVYQTKIISYCPQVTQFESDYFDTIQGALGALKERLKTY